MKNSRSEKLKKHWATLSKEKRSERTRAGGKALWAKIKNGDYLTK